VWLEVKWEGEKRKVLRKRGIVALLVLFSPWGRI